MVLNHGDFHPGNLLWKRDCLSAVVDWSATRLGPRWWELAYFRMELAVLADAWTTDMLLKSYEAKVGVESSQQAVWDLLCLYNGHRWGQRWLVVAYRRVRTRSACRSLLRSGQSSVPVLAASAVCSEMRRRGQRRAWRARSSA